MKHYLEPRGQRHEKREKRENDEKNEKREKDEKNEKREKSETPHYNGRNHSCFGERETAGRWFEMIPRGIQRHEHKLE